MTHRAQCETRHDVATATESGSPRMRIPALALLATLSLFGACQQNAPMNKSEVVHGYVTDMNAFDQFIAGKPTPDQFKAAYPDMQNKDKRRVGKECVGTCRTRGSRKH